LADFLQKPVPVLIFEDFDVFDQARLALRDAAAVKFGTGNRLGQNA
jgi:hypothetical protein